MKKTNRMAQINQYLGGRIDRIIRRIWTDGKDEYIKVEGTWFTVNDYRTSKHHTVETWY